MFNVTVTGQTVDEYGYQIDCYYQANFKDRGILSPIFYTENKFFNLNTGDRFNLGSIGNLRKNEFFYINFWQGTVNKTTIHRYGLKYVKYNNESIIFFDGILKPSWDIFINLEIKKIKLNKYLLNSNAVNYTKIIFRIYLALESLFEDNPDTLTWTLVSTKETTNIEERVNILSKGKYKIECEALDDNDYSSGVQEKIIDVKTKTKQLYIEWG